ncbi:uncharacterized protein LOC127266358 [Andrographis paniculata]|uniref:uncharacterized protein LOC127266358 n=1 Tax=Andrographis paniculata TaxID=175694 RepID=UPI0021E94475|nr:uncharacterized protein LOC127266358 [Andrographis paniculata]
MFEIQLRQIAEAMKLKLKGTLPGTVETVLNQAKTIETRSGKRTQSPPLPDRGTNHSSTSFFANFPVHDNVIHIPTEEEGPSQPRALKVTIPFADALSHMPHNAKFIKDIINRKHAFPDEAAAVQLESIYMTLETLEEISDNGSLKLDGVMDSSGASDTRTTPPESIEKEKKEPASDAYIKDELKLPEPLKYIYLGLKETYLLIISASLLPDQEAQLVSLLKRRKAAFAWKITDINGINPAVCMHYIRLDADARPCRQPQRRLNENMQEVGKKEVIKLFDAGIIHPISDSQWVSPTQVVPKKGGFVEQTRDKGEVFMTRPVTGWRVYIDYRRFNAITKKDHFLLPFLDQCLKKLAGHEYYYFLDGYLGYHQIPIKPEDYEKTTFTSPYGMFAYRRMPFGLCNAPTTFQLCMYHIFSDLLDSCIEVFMDDFSVYGKTFFRCLNNLEKVLFRCIETNLVLNWEKCHLMVNEGIVLGHKISAAAIEVDISKINVIENMPAHSNGRE